MYEQGNRNKEVYFWESRVVKFSYLIHCDTLLQNVTNIITKCDSHSFTKCDKIFIQNASGFLLQNATVITNCFDFITKFDVYYKYVSSQC